MGKKKEIYVESLGFSTTQVTGSCWAIQYTKDDGEEVTQVIECGLPQGDKTILESYNSMKRMADSIKGGGFIANCKNVFIQHSHVPTSRPYRLDTNIQRKKWI